MKTIKKLFDKNSTHEQIERHMSQLLEEKFDQELKTKYQRILAEKHQVQRESVGVKKNWNKTIAIVGIVVLALMLLFVSQYYNASTKFVNYEQLALSYNQEKPFDFNISSRSAGNEESQTAIAYAAYQKSNYEETISVLSQQENLSNEQSFLLGYTYFEKGDYQLAISAFEKVTIENGDEAYTAEAKLYGVLSHFSLNQKEEAFAKMDAMDPSSWEYKELDSILN